MFGKQRQIDNLRRELANLEWKVQGQADAIQYANRRVNEILEHDVSLRWQIARDYDLKPTGILFGSKTPVPAATATARGRSA